MTISICSARRRFPTRLMGQVGMLAYSLAALVAMLAIASTATGQSNPPNRKAAPGTVSRTKHTGAIAGRVVDESGQPIEDAAVMIAPAGQVNPASVRGVSAVARLRSVVADETGHFSVEDLETGIYYVRATVPGYVQVNEDRLSRQAAHRPGDSVTLRMAKGGVITGRVTGPTSEPVVGILMGATRINKNGEAASDEAFGDGMQPSQSSIMMQVGQFSTDDRGVYRIYGLQPGAYLVSAGVGRSYFQILDPFSGSAPTYYPSSTRGGATPVQVRLGEETSDIDIRFRDQPGHSISGTVIGKVSSSLGLSINIIALAEGQTQAPVGMSVSLPLPDNGGPAFTFGGIPDGDYRIQAVAGDYSAASNTREISVKGADVSGIELVLTRFSSISGHVDIDKPLEQSAACKTVSQLRSEEILVYARVDSKKGARPQLNILFSGGSEAVPDNRGEFSIHLLREGLHRIEARPAGEDYYIRSVTLPSNSPTGRRDASRSGILIKPAENLSGIAISISPGAAGIAGKVVPGSGSTEERLPDSLRVHLIPAEKEGQEEVLRFAETGLNSGYTFKFTNIAPGRYWVIAVKSSDDPRPGAEPRPMAWDAEGRAKLRKLGAETKVEIELKPCQREKDYVLRNVPSVSPS